MLVAVDVEMFVLFVAVAVGLWVGVGDGAFGEHRGGMADALALLSSIGEDINFVYLPQTIINNSINPLNLSVLNILPQLNQSLILQPLHRHQIHPIIPPALIIIHTLNHQLLLFPLLSQHKFKVPIHQYLPILSVTHQLIFLALYSLV